MLITITRCLTTTDRKGLKKLLDNKREGGLLIPPQRAINDEYRICFVLYPRYMPHVSYMNISNGNLEVTVYLDDINILDKPISVTIDKELIVNVI